MVGFTKLSLVAAFLVAPALAFHYDFDEPLYRRLPTEDGAEPPPIAAPRPQRPPPAFLSGTDATEKAGPPGVFTEFYHSDIHPAFPPAAQNNAQPQQLRGNEAFPPNSFRGNKDLTKAASLPLPPVDRLYHPAIGPTTNTNQPQELGRTPTPHAPKKASTLPAGGLSNPQAPVGVSGPSKGPSRAQILYGSAFDKDKDPHETPKMSNAQAVYQGGLGIDPAPPPNPDSGANLSGWKVTGMDAIKPARPSKPLKAAPDHDAAQTNHNGLPGPVIHSSAAAQAINNRGITNHRNLQVVQGPRAQGGRAQGGRHLNQ